MNARFLFILLISIGGVDIGVLRSRIFYCFSQLRQRQPLLPMHPYNDPKNSRELGNGLNVNRETRGTASSERIMVGDSRQKIRAATTSLSLVDDVHSQQLRAENLKRSRRQQKRLMQLNKSLQHHFPDSNSSSGSEFDMNLIPYRYPDKRSAIPMSVEEGVASVRCSFLAADCTVERIEHDLVRAYVRPNDSVLEVRYFSIL